MIATGVATCDIFCTATVVSNDKKFPVIHDLILAVQITTPYN